MTHRETVVYLDGDFLPLGEARISPLDRGFLFGDGIYEAVAFYRGSAFRWADHERRLRRGLAALEIELDPSPLAGVMSSLVERNGLADRDSLAYLQVTRGAAPRTHAFPDPPVHPTVYAAVQPWCRHSEERAGRGVAAITVPDQRWARCDVKSLNLLPNVLAHQRAVRAGVFEALLVRDGFVLEASHSSLFAVRGGALTTAPASNYLLGGVTAAVILELAEELGVPSRREPLGLEDLFGVDELFLTGTSTEVLPLVEVDGRPVGGGSSGALTLRLREHFLEATLSSGPAGGGLPDDR